MKGQLYLGDNLEVLRRRIPDGSVDLVYLDPPFNSGANYAIPSCERSDGGAEAQTFAFEDTWRWGPESEKALGEVLERHERLGRLLELLARSPGKEGLPAYLAMMAVRLIELHRVLKPTGSLYLYCDPTASHYLKVILDQIFGPENFRSEVVWKRTSAHSSAKRWGPVHDVILFYTKGEDYTWNPLHQAYEEGYLEREYRFQDERGRYAPADLTGAGEREGDSGRPWRNIFPTKGRHWALPRREKLPPWVNPPENWEMMTAQEKLDFLDQVGLIHWPKKGRMPYLKRYLETQKGIPAQDVILDIPPLGSTSKERVGYPTQKPVALLERIVRASSNPGDTVLDPFCGSGTTLIAAQKLGREWIGIDNSPLAITLTRARLERDFGLMPGRGYAMQDLP
jgi:site-specific DNA-methyltransferase (adenine-specific)